MRHLPITLAAIFIITLVSCDQVEDIVAPVDPLIDEEVMNSQDYNLTTPFYGMQVAIDSRVDTGTERILELLDNTAEQFLDCQFAEGSQIGFEDFMLDDGTVVPPLSELRVYVVPNRFECEAEGRNECGGEYFSALDAIALSEGGFAGCGEFIVWKHELGHRYGMEPDHSNQSDFGPCINTEVCDFDDIFD